MKKILMALMASVLVACAGPLEGLKPNAAIAASYQSVEILVDQATGAVLRGRMSPEQGQKVKDASVKARKTIKEAEDALALCGVDAQRCASMDKILDRVQPILLEMERELRAKEKKQ